MKLKSIFKKTPVTKPEVKEAASKVKPEVPEGLLKRCNKCGKGIFTEDYKKNLYICPKCGGYFKVRAYERIRRVADEGTFQESDRELVGENPLGFEGYEEKLAAERLKTRMKEAIVTGTGSIDGIPAAIGVMDSRFMMASMG